MDILNIPAMIGKIYIYIYICIYMGKLTDYGRLDILV